MITQELDCSTDELRKQADNHIDLTVAELAKKALGESNLTSPRLTRLVGSIDNNSFYHRYYVDIFTDKQTLFLDAVYNIKELKITLKYEKAV